MQTVILARILLFGISFISQLSVFSDVIKRTVDNWTLVLWIINLFFFYIAFPYRPEKNIVNEKKEGSPSDFKVYLYAILIIALGLAIRIILMQNSNAFHNDEYITAYFSYSLGDVSKLDWFAIYPIPHDWVFQSPVLYFLLQKIFFNLFGLGTLVMRLSILPYLIVIFSSFFLITKRLYGKEAAFLTITILAVFSPDLYLTRWALHHICCTAFFLLTIYFIVLSIQFGNKKYFALTGFFLGMCYMSYTSSFIAAPLIFFYAFMIILSKQARRPIALNFLLTLGVFIYTISPLAIYAIKVHNFTLTRLNQVKLINGSWSPYQGVKIISEQSFEIVKNQAILCIKSLYKDSIGGFHGYTFGYLALFDRITFFFILLGIFYFFLRFFKMGDVNSLFIITVIFATFVTGMVLTIPPPAFQRISLIFPFICLLISVTIINIYTLIAKKLRKIATILLITVVTLVLTSNILQFKKIMIKDGPDDPDYPQIQQYLEQQNNNMFYIAAFPTYGMGGIFFIRSGGKINSVTQRLDELLEIIPQSDTSFLVILYPNEELIQKVKTKFINTVLIANYQKHALLRIN